MIVIPAIVAEAVQGLEQSLDKFIIVGQYHNHLRVIDRFYVETLLNYVRNATDDERCAVAKLLREGKNNAHPSSDEGHGSS